MDGASTQTQWGSSWCSPNSPVGSDPVCFISGSARPPPILDPACLLRNRVNILIYIAFFLGLSFSDYESERQEAMVEPDYKDRLFSKHRGLLNCHETDFIFEKVRFVTLKLLMFYCIFLS